MKTKMTNRTKALLMTKKGEINQQIKRMISNCHFGNDCKIYPKYYHGSWRFTSVYDASNYVKMLIESQGGKIEDTGNDSPRGGAKGYYIQTTPAVYYFLLSLTR